MTAAPYLRLVAYDDVILHGVGDVVHGELQEGSLGNVDQADARPGGAAVLGVGPLHHRHPLEERAKRGGGGGGGGGGEEEEEGNKEKEWR